MDFVIKYGSVFLLAYILIVPKGSFCYTISKFYVTGKERLLALILSYIPGINTCKVRECLYGKYGMWMLTYILIYVTFVVCIVLRFAVPDAELVQIIITFVLLLDIIILWAVEGFIIFDCGGLFDAKLWVRVVGFILPPLGAELVKADAERALRESQEERQNVFEGGDSW